VDGRELLMDVLPVGPSLYSLLLDGRSYEVDILELDGALVVHVSGQPFRVELEQERQASRHEGATRRTAASGGSVTAPMPGKIVRVLVRAGESVQAGAAVAVIEAMKMENELRAEVGGRVRDVRVAEGKTVSAGDVLVVLE
jgi:biotin carboxyl carrier protein